MQGVTLLVLAGGMGSRFGGDKQLATIGDTGKTLLHFSVMDAYAAGVRDLVLVIRPELENAFRQQVLRQLPADLRVDLVPQRTAELPAGVKVDWQSRQKPWGTAHAIWVARQHLTQPFIVINADDYYGAKAMQLLVHHFQTSQHWAMVAYPLSHTLSEHGGVNRGICKVEAGQLQAVAEYTAITQDASGALTGCNSDGQHSALSPETLVSMNIWGFYPTVLLVLEQALTGFFNAQPAAKAECYLPAVVDTAIGQGQPLQVYTSTQRWLGMTYQADLAELNRFFAGQ